MTLETLQAEILDLRSRMSRCAHTLADIGDRLIAARELVPEGEWIAWVETNLEFSRYTARHYMILAALRRDDPARFDAVTAQGLRAAYALNRSTSAACPLPERFAARIERLAKESACVEGATAEARARARALEAVDALRREVESWTS